MTDLKHPLSVSDLLSYFHSEKRYQQFAKLVDSVAETQPDDFTKYGNTLLDWAVRCLGEGCLGALAEGYARFVQDVTRSQMLYENAGSYKHSSYAEVFESTYNNPEFMNFYHWGVYVTTFAWPHHLDICRFFHERFLPKMNSITESGRCLDLGSGSGVWSMLMLNANPGWSSHGVDISEFSISKATEMAAASGFAERFKIEKNDALEFSDPDLFDGAISCFLLEHLERPERLVENIANHLKPRGYVFLTGALTAAETDHITEFKSESELVDMAESAGLRVVELLSAAPPLKPDDSRIYLPRSTALILQKKKNSIW